MAATITSLSFEQATFPVIDCKACGTQSLTYVDGSTVDVELVRCLHCDAPVDPATPIKPSGTRAVEALGYVFMRRSRSTPGATKKGGCGTKGVRSCGSGGCSSGGSCSSGGGCSSGGCGTK